MRASVVISWRTAQGEALTLDWPLISIEYALAVNAVSRLTATFAARDALPEMLIPDGQMTVLRCLPDGNTHTPGPYRWLVQRTVQEQGRLTVHAVSPLWLISEPGWVVADYADTPQTRKTGPADNIIKAVIAEGGSLNKPIPGLIIGPQTSVCPTLTRGFAWRETLRVCQDIAQASQQEGVYLAFDITATPDGWLFETYPFHRGVDRRDTLCLSLEDGSLANAKLTLDYESEATAVIVGGQGEGAARTLGAAEDANRQARTPYRFRQSFRDMTTTDDAAQLTAEARRILRESRPRLTLDGEIGPALARCWGAAWEWGDLVRVSAYGYTLDARLDAVSVRWTPGGGEEIRAIIRTEQYV